MNPKQEITSRQFQAQDLPNQRLRDATLRMVRSLKSRPEPRWQWDNVASDRAAPWRPLLRLINDAIDAGAPVEDALAPVFELEAQARARAKGGYVIGEPGSMFLMAFVDEARADADADVAQAEAAAAPSRVALERVIDATESQIRKARELARVCRAALSAPMRFGRRSFS